MGTQTDKKIVSIYQNAPIDLSRRFLIAHGAPVIPKKFKQNATTAEDLHNLAAAAETLFLEEMRIIRRDLGMSKLIVPGLKTIARIQQKADTEKSGDVSQIFDPLRVAFVADTPSKIKKAIDFFTPAHNSSVISLIDQFARPDIESGMRRAKITYQMPNVYAEIQIWHKDMLTAFDSTHKPYERQRNIRSTLMTAACALLPYGACTRLQSQEQVLAELRKDVHNHAAKKAGLNKLVQEREFGKIGPIPFVAIKRPIDDFPTILRPDPCSKTYVQDNALATAYQEGRFTPTSRDAFIMASHNLVTNHDWEIKPRAIRNTRHLDRA